MATLGSSEMRLTVRPPGGAADDRLSVRLCVLVPTIVRVGGEKVSVAVTCTAALAGA